MHLALPRDNHTPASGLQCNVFISVAGNVPVELGLPELHVGLGLVARPALLVPMPETSVDEGDRVPFWEHDVGMPGQFGRMQIVADLQCMQVMAYDHFQLCVLRPNSPHVCASLL